MYTFISVGPPYRPPSEGILQNFLTFTAEESPERMIWNVPRTPAVRGGVCARATMMTDCNYEQRLSC